MRLRKALAALIVPLAFVGAACGAQEGCYDDGERVSCNFDDDDREFDDDDEGEWDDD